MSVIAVVNRKGGSGKSTLATHIAAYLAGRGEEVMLGDIDKLQSSRLWLSLRGKEQAKIHGWSIDEKNFARPPAGVKHVVLDTPGGFHGFGLMKVTLYADAILIPASAGVFDRNSAAESIKELRSFPRVASGRCKLACIGMRIDGRTRQAQALREWAETQELPCLSTIRMAQAYNKCLEVGLALFDFPQQKVETFMPEWQPVTHWIDEILAAAAPAPGSHGSREELRTRQPLLHSAQRPILQQA